jgi:hypothetical protein
MPGSYLCPIFPIARYKEKTIFIHLNLFVQFWVHLLAIFLTDA